jgi:hypothetical protein
MRLLDSRTQNAHRFRGGGRWFTIFAALIEEKPHFPLRICELTWHTKQMYSTQRLGMNAREF